MAFSAAEMSNDFCRDLNTKHFIEEVQLRPAIWDTTCDDYNDKKRRRECWEELTYLFLAKSDVATPVSEAEREIFTRLLQRRWKNVRDCYTRELLRYKKIKSGGIVPRKSTYLYFKQLSFLRDVVKPDKKRGKTRSTGEEPSRTVVKREPQNISISTENSCGDTSNQSFNDPLFTKETEVRLDEDCDRLFLLSLLKPLQKIPEDERFNVKMEMMQVIQNAQRSVRNGVRLMELEESSVMNFEEHSLDSIKEPLTPTLSENDDE